MLSCQNCGELRIKAIYSPDSWTDKDPSQLGPHFLFHRPHLYVLPQTLPMHPFPSVLLDSPSGDQKAALCFISRDRESVFVQRTERLSAPAQAQVINNTSVPAKTCQTLPSGHSVARGRQDSNMEQKASNCSLREVLGAREWS